MRRCSSRRSLFAPLTSAPLSTKSRSALPDSPPDRPTLSEHLDAACTRCTPPRSATEGGPTFRFRQAVRAVSTAVLVNSVKPIAASALTLRRSTCSPHRGQPCARRRRGRSSNLRMPAEAAARLISAPRSSRVAPRRRHPCSMLASVASCPFDACSPTASRKPQEPAHVAPDRQGKHIIIKKQPPAAPHPPLLASQTRKVLSNRPTHEPRLARRRVRLLFARHLLLRVPRAQTAPRRPRPSPRCARNCPRSAGEAKSARRRICENSQSPHLLHVCPRARPAPRRPQPGR